jgi:hypothetical protein
VWNQLTADTTLQLAEGLDVFRVPVPDEVVGRTLEKAHIRESTGCTVVAVVEGDTFRSNPTRELRSRPAPTSCSSATTTPITASSAATAAGRAAVGRAAGLDRARRRLRPGTERPPPRGADPHPSGP